MTHFPRADNRLFFTPSKKGVNRRNSYNTSRTERAKEIERECARVCVCVCVRAREVVVASRTLHEEVVAIVVGVYGGGGRCNARRGRPSHLYTNPSYRSHFFHWRRHRSEGPSTACARDPLPTLAAFLSINVQIFG